MTLYTPHPVSAFMKCADARPDCKEYVIGRRVTVITGSEVDAAWFGRLFEASREAGEHRIVAAEHDGKLHAADGIKILSDGKSEMFVKSNRGDGKKRTSGHIGGNDGSRAF